VYGIYPTDAPIPLQFKKEAWRMTWIKNLRYWRMLVEHMGFPIAKVNEPDQVGNLGFPFSQDGNVEGDILLKNCTKHFPREEIFDGLDFTFAKPFYQRRWEHLPETLQQVAHLDLGFDALLWVTGRQPPNLVGKTWRELTVAQQTAWKKFGCTPVFYDRKLCRIDKPDPF
jgi:hypothetical protein